MHVCRLHYRRQVKVHNNFSPLFHTHFYILLTWGHDGVRAAPGNPTFLNYATPSAAACTSGTCRGRNMSGESSVDGLNTTLHILSPVVIRQQTVTILSVTRPYHCYEPATTITTQCHLLPLAIPLAPHLNLANQNNLACHPSTPFTTQSTTT